MRAVPACRRGGRTRRGGRGQPLHEPALAKMSTIRALLWLTFCGACRPEKAVLKVTVPAPDGKVTAPVAGL